MSGLSINSSINALVDRHKTNRSSASSQSKNLQKVANGLSDSQENTVSDSVSVSGDSRNRPDDNVSSLRKLQDDISFVQSIKKEASQTTESLKEIRELVSQAKNNTDSTDERRVVQDEIDRLTNRIDETANQVSFNGGESRTDETPSGETGRDLQSEAGPDQLSISGLSSNGLNIDSLNVVNNPDQSMDQVNTAINEVATLNAEADSIEDTLQSTLDTERIQRENRIAAQDRLNSTDRAEQISTQTQSALRTDGNTSVMAQVNNLNESNMLQLLG